jgi:hypothetical protein
MYFPIIIGVSKGLSGGGVWQIAQKISLRPFKSLWDILAIPFAFSKYFSPAVSLRQFLS